MSDTTQAVIDAYWEVVDKVGKQNAAMAIALNGSTQTPKTLEERAKEIFKVFENAETPQFSGPGC